MEPDSGEIYTSCIKINGIPILPPLMTEDVREEMNYYKQLAIAVEERLRYLRISKKAKSRLQQNESSETFVECEKSSELRDTKDSETLETELDTTQEDSVLSKLSKTSSEEDYNYQPKPMVNDSPSSDAITASTDLNHYLNESTMSTKTTTGETTPEIWKPQVPKTLNIVPITLGGPSGEQSKSSEETPKMVRQGSYVLDTPSPILLAHLQTSEYVPSSTTVSKRREWNISQAKSKWERSKPQVSSTPDSGKSTPKMRPRRNSASSVQNHKTNKIAVRGKAPLSQRSAKSVDAINTMSPKDFGSRASSRSDTPVNRMKENVSVLTLADQLSVEFEESKQNKNCNVNEATTLSSDRVMGFLHEIQEMQKQKMIELLEKQQQEQLKMQEEFKKQQMALMMQIRKAFPESSVLMHGVDEVLDNRVQCDEDNNVERCPMMEYVCPLDRYLGKNGNENCNTRMTRSLDSDAMFQRDDIQFYNDQRIETISNDNYCSDDVNDRHSSVSRRLFALGSRTTRGPVFNNSLYTYEHHSAVTVINAYVRGYLVRRLMKTEQVIALKNTYKEALHCMLKLHVDAPLNLSELNFHRRLQLQLDAASSNIVDLFAQEPARRMEIIAHDRELKKSRTERPSSARSYSFATQRTLARKKMKEMGDYYTPLRKSKSSSTIRARCQTWTSNSKEKRQIIATSQGIKRSTSAGAVRKPWR